MHTHSQLCTDQTWESRVVGTLCSPLPWVLSEATTGQGAWADERAPSGLGALVPPFLPACRPQCCFLGPGFGLAGWEWLSGAGLAHPGQPGVPCFHIPQDQNTFRQVQVRGAGSSRGLTLQQRLPPELREVPWEMRPAGPPRWLVSSLQSVGNRLASGLAWDAPVVAPGWAPGALWSHRQPRSSVRATASSSSSSSSRTDRTEEPNHRLQRLPMAESSWGTCGHQRAVSRCAGLGPRGVWPAAGPAPTTALGSRLAHRVNGCLVHRTVVELLVEDVHLGHVAPGARQRCEGLGPPWGTEDQAGRGRAQDVPSGGECTHLRLGLWLRLLWLRLPSTARIQSCTHKARWGCSFSQPSGRCGAGVKSGDCRGTGWSRVSPLGPVRPTCLSAPYPPLQGTHS